MGVVDHEFVSRDAASLFSFSFSPFSFIPLPVMI